MGRQDWYVSKWTVLDAFFRESIGHSVSLSFLFTSVSFTRRARWGDWKTHMALCKQFMSSSHGWQLPVPAGVFRELRSELSVEVTIQIRHNRLVERGHCTHFPDEEIESKRSNNRPGSRSLGTAESASMPGPASSTLCTFHYDMDVSVAACFDRVERRPVDSSRADG